MGLLEEQILAGRHFFHPSYPLIRWWLADFDKFLIKHQLIRVWNQGRGQDLGQLTRAEVIILNEISETKNICSTQPCNYLSCWKISDVWKYFLNKSCSQGDKYSAPALYRLQLKFELGDEEHNEKLIFSLDSGYNGCVGTWGGGQAASEGWEELVINYLDYEPSARCSDSVVDTKSGKREGWRERNHFYFPGLAN